MDSNGAPSVLLAALLGFLVGGVVAEWVQSAAGILLAFGTLSALAGSACAAVAKRDVTRWGAVGGGVGLLVGIPVAILDRVLGG